MFAYAYDGTPIESPPIEDINENKAVATNKGKLLMDATVAPQNITYPTDLKLLNAAREKSETLIDKLYNKTIHGSEKVRTYREMARKYFLNAARKKAKSGKEIYKANGTQIRYLKRNLGHITTLLLAYKQQGVATPLKQKDIDYLYTLELVYHQQHTMHSTNTHQIEKGNKLMVSSFMSTKSKTRVLAKFSSFHIHKWRKPLETIAQKLTPVIQGVLNYHGKFWTAHMYRLWYQLNQRLLKWVKWEKGLYKTAAIKWLKQKYKEQPRLFPHWQLVHP